MLLRREEALPCGCVPMQGILINTATGQETQDWQTCDTTAGVALMLDGQTVNGQWEQRCGTCPNVWK